MMVENEAEEGRKCCQCLSAVWACMNQCTYIARCSDSRRCLVVMTRLYTSGIECRLIPMSVSQASRLP